MAFPPVGILWSARGPDRTRKVEMTRALPGQAGLRPLVLISVFLPWLCSTQGGLEVLRRPVGIRQLVVTS